MDGTAQRVVKTLAVGPLQSNCYLFGSSDSGRGVIIDPGEDADLILAEWEKTGLKLQAILNTHGHFDHAGGNRRLKEATGVPILVHEEDAGMITRIGAQSGLFGLRTEDSPPPDGHLVPGEEVDLGGLSLEILHTPGHTRGGVSLFTPGLVFTGDTLFAGSVGRTDLPGGSYEVMISSIREKLLALDDETVVLPGHGPATTIGRERSYNPFLV